MHSSNVTGEIFDVKKIFAKAKSFKLKNPKNEEEIFTICDMTASAGHIKINVEELCCDAAYFSAHKMCGPTGVGILYIKRNLMREMYPATFGGGMVSEVLSDSSTYRSDIKRFEAGTPNIAGAIGYGAAVDYINNLDIEKIREHTKNILKYAVEELTKLEDRGVVKIFTEKNFEKNIGIISFEVYKKADLRNKNYKNSDETSNKNLTIHPHDVAQILADNNIAVRSGHHCAALLMDHLAVTSLTRASFYFYNTKKDVDALIQNIIKTQEVFSKQT